MTSITTLEIPQDECAVVSHDHRDLLTIPETLRRDIFASPRAEQKALAQFLTPPHVAALMASMFECRGQDIRLLDAGAGLGILSAAFVRQQLLLKPRPKRIEITAYELDATLAAGLETTYRACQRACQAEGVEFQADIRRADFIEAGTAIVGNDMFASRPHPFDAAIVNPPYGKLSTTSLNYRRLRTIRAETTNLYAAFLNLIIRLLRTGGELVAITPRSFCNGPYFKPFRRSLLSGMALRRIHVFESRTQAFRHDEVLQENVIVHAVKGLKPPANICISQSAGGANDPIHARSHPLEDVLIPGDRESFIHIPTTAEHRAARDVIQGLPETLASLGLDVSTGRVVSFRMRSALLEHAQPDAVPLVHPCHFNGLYVSWPTSRNHKPNAIQDNERTRQALIPADVYVLIKRFTSKEERRRVVACIFNPTQVHASRVGFENHLNVIHASGCGLEMTLAKGVWAYLNSTTVDQYFRQFNGHTQVNATDLRNMRFPSREQLLRLGRRMGDAPLEQDQIDRRVKKELGT